MISESIIDATIGRMFADSGFPDSPAGLYDPLRYMLEIGGKRVRPRLSLTVYSLFRDEIDEPALEVFKALEIFHTFTLIHDDIMDRSPLRRGMPTVWARWNEDTAILSGDVMLIESYKSIAKTPAKMLDGAMKLFSDTAAQVCEGQQLDMEFETLPRVEMADYERMIGLKTAVLLACSAEMGAMLAGAGKKACKALYDYGYNLGMAFQVADDYLDTFGDEKVFGKPIGGDIVNGKKSWLLTRAFEKPEGEPVLGDALALPVGTPEERMAKIARVRGVYEALGVDADAKCEILHFSRQAMESVRSLQLGSLRMEVLKRFVDKLVGRAK